MVQKCQGGVTRDYDTGSLARVLVSQSSIGMGRQLASSWPRWAELLGLVRKSGLVWAEWGRGTVKVASAGPFKRLGLGWAVRGSWGRRGAESRRNGAVFAQKKEKEKRNEAVPWTNLSDVFPGSLCEIFVF